MTNDDRATAATVAQEGETPYEWLDGEIVFQRACDGCDKGLIYAPVRFCGRCGGSGYLLRFPQRVTRLTAEDGA